MKMCESCGEDEVLWLDTTSGDPEPEVEVLCFDCYDKYPWHGRCQLCGVWGWVNSDEKCWGCSCNELMPCEWGQTACICSVCTGDCGRTDLTLACQECQHCQYDPTDFE